MQTSTSHCCPLALTSYCLQRQGQQSPLGPQNPPRRPKKNLVQRTSGGATVETSASPNFTTVMGDTSAGTALTRWIAVSDFVRHILSSWIHHWFKCACVSVMGLQSKSLSQPPWSILMPVGIALCVALFICVISLCIRSHLKHQQECGVAYSSGRPGNPQSAVRRSRRPKGRTQRKILLVTLRSLSHRETALFCLHQMAMEHTRHWQTLSRPSGPFTNTCLSYGFAKPVKRSYVPIELPGIFKWKWVDKSWFLLDILFMYRPAIQLHIAWANYEGSHLWNQSYALVDFYENKL